jgi:ABC-type antimicrobial peptide transport system permease subunit
VSRVALEGSVYWAMRTVPLDLGDVNLSVPAADWRVGLFVVAAAVAACAFFALMPARQATRIEPVRTLRGELVKDARPGRARNILIGVQVFASALLLICAAIFLRSAIASSRFNPGLRTGDTMLIQIINEQRTKEIGLRIALGASSPMVTQLMLSQTARPVIYGLLAGAGLAATLATAVLATPAGAMIGEIVHVADPVAYAASLTVIVAACLAAAWIPATRAARVDPMQTLRQE